MAIRGPDDEPIGETVDRVFFEDVKIHRIIMPIRMTDEAIIKAGGDPDVYPQDEHGLRIVGPWGGRSE